MLPGPRYYAAAIAIRGFVYLVGGAASGEDVPVGTLDRAAILADGSLGGFERVPGIQLVQARLQPTLEVIGDMLYVIGGSGGEALASVERAPIAPDGSLGAFETTGVQLVTPRTHHLTAVLGSWLYAIGGVDSANAEPVLTVERAALDADGGVGAFEVVAGSTTSAPNSSLGRALVLGDAIYVPVGALGPTHGFERAELAADGTLGAFSPASGLAFPAATCCFTSAITGDHVYFVGGATGGDFAVGTSARASIDGDGALASSVPGSPPLAAPRAFFAGAVVGDGYFAIGGLVGGAPASTVEQAQLGADGALAPFTATTGLVTPRHRHATVVAGDAILVAGGHGATGTLRSIERATVAADGSLGGFATLPVELASPREAHAMVALGRFVYAIGGTGTGSIERAAIGSGGALGPFTAVAATLTSARGGFGVAVIGSFLYVFGGGGTAVVERAPIAADGTLGTFADAGTLTVAREAPAIAIVGGFVYAIGGRGSTGSLDTVERAAIRADGSLGAFTAVPTTKLVEARHGASAIVAADSVYLVGGEGASGALATVERLHL